MATTPLVDADVAMGKELLDILDRAQFPVTGAAWIYFADLGQWRLIIRTPKAETDLLSALTQLANTMDAAGDLRTRLDFSRLKLVPPKDQMLAAIGSVIKVDGVSTIRFD